MTTKYTDYPHIDGTRFFCKVNINGVACGKQHRRHDYDICFQCARSFFPDMTSPAYSKIKPVTIKAPQIVPLMADIENSVLSVPQILNMIRNNYKYYKDVVINETMTTATITFSKPQ